MDFKITYYFEILSFVAGLLSLILILRKNRKYFPNVTAGVGLFLVGCHPFSIFLYDVIATDISVQILLRFGIMSSLAGITLIYFTMKCMVKSVTVFKRPQYWVPFVVIDIVIYIYLILADFIEIQPSTVGNINITISIGPLAVIGVATLFYLIMSVIDLYMNGIRKTNDSFQKKKMTWFISGLLFSLTSIFSTIGSQFAAGTFGVILDIAFLVTLSISCLVMMVSFILKKPIESEKSSIEVD